MAEETKKETQSEMVPIIATEGTMVCPGCKTTLDCPSGEPWIVCGKCKAEFCTEKGDDAEGAAEAKYELNWRVIHKFKYVEEKEGKGNPFPHLVFPSPFPEHLEYLGLTEEEVKGEIDDLNKILQKTELSKCCYFFICETQESADRTRSLLRYTFLRSLFLLLHIAHSSFSSFVLFLFLVFFLCFLVSLSESAEGRGAQQHVWCSASLYSIAWFRHLDTCHLLFF
uniref:Uncharacterized protein n=1 Tax=Lotharella globosa TaxID=91324 RepID=A0A7S3YJ77_9EUKA